MKAADSGVLVHETFEGKKQSAFHSSPLLSIVDCDSIEEDESDRAGRCLKIDLKTDRGNLGGIPRIPVDVRKRYRFSFDCFIPKNGWIQYGG